MRTTLEFEGFPEVILQKAVDLGIARSKTDALRMGIFALNNEFHLVENPEAEIVARKLAKEEKEMKKNNVKYLSDKEALSKYQ
jgi:hypothetical protein